MADPVFCAVSEHYTIVARDLLNSLLDLMTVSRAACGGDVDKFLILLAIAVRASEHPSFRDLSSADLAEGRFAVLPSQGINVRSISASLRIPPETARRKVTELIEAGWIVRHRRSLMFTGQGARETEPMRIAIQRLAVRNFSTVRGVAEAG